jgi:acyl-CoA synthetase (AMP-forming)/AMP-acid ligase II
MLREALGRVGGDLALVDDRGRWSGDRLSARLPVGAPRPDPVAAVRVRRAADLIRALAALEGVASAVVLLSHAQPDEVAARLAADAGATLVVTDGPALAGAGALDPADLYPDDVEPADAPRLRETRILLSTSGTTGAPKLVSHALASLTRTTRPLRPGADRPRWGLLYDPTRFAGFQVLLQGLIGGGVLTEPPAGAPLGEQLAFLAAEGCTHLSATPTMWRKILLTASTIAPRQITLGGEIADGRVLDALARRFPEARITHIFASTEAGVGFSVKDGRPGFPRAYLDAPPAGIALAVREGRLYVRNPHVEARYVATGETFGDADGFIDTGDQVALEGDRVLFLGRASGVINVGGNKVFPERVEGVLAAHPRVRLARVYAKRNPLTGALVAADVVPEGEPGDEALGVALKAWCADRLERHEAPAILRFVPDLDVNATGKLARTLP